MDALQAPSGTALAGAARRQSLAPAGGQGVGYIHSQLMCAAASAAARPVRAGSTVDARGGGIHELTGEEGPSHALLNAGNGHSSAPPHLARCQMSARTSHEVSGALGWSSCWTGTYFRHV